MYPKVHINVKHRTNISVKTEQKIKENQGRLDEL